MYRNKKRVKKNKAEEKIFEPPDQGLEPSTLAPHPAALDNSARRGKQEGDDEEDGAVECRFMIMIILYLLKTANVDQQLCFEKCPNGPAALVNENSLSISMKV